MAIIVFQDWSVQTSKGCFFYEDDEIVTHVYNLNIREESAVYFTAYPIQEPASCKYQNKDWSMQTSKGCFFYEDDEIVTHVYNLN